MLLHRFTDSQILLYCKSRDSSVGIALGYRLEDRGSRVRFPAGAGNFSLHYCVQNGSGAHPTSYPMGTGALSLGVKRLGREADHSPPSSAEVKNAWSYTSTPQYVFMAWCLVKQLTVILCNTVYTILPSRGINREFCHSVLSRFNIFESNHINRKQNMQSWLSSGNSWNIVLL
jgi:hypothetical protein